MAYGAKSNDLKEGAALGTGIHKGIFLKKVEKTVNTEGKIWEALDFRFENKKGDYYLYRIFNPESGDDEAKVAKAQVAAAGKSVYIVSKVSGKDVELKDVDSFDGFVAAVLATLPENFEKIPLEIKLVGNVYGGKGNVQAPNLVNGGFIGGGWVRREDSGEALTLSPQDKKAIAEYESFIQNTSKSSTAISAIDNDFPAPDGEVVF